MPLIDDAFTDRLRTHLALSAVDRAPAGLDHRILEATRRSSKGGSVWRSELFLGSAMAVAVSSILAVGLHQRSGHSPAPWPAVPATTGRQGYGGGGPKSAHTPLPVVFPEPSAATVSAGTPAPGGRPTTTFVVVVTAARPDTEVVLGGPGFLSLPGFDPYGGGISLCGSAGQPPCRSGGRYQRTFVGLASDSGTPGYVSFKLEALPERRVFAAGRVDVKASLVYTATVSELP